MKQSAYHMVREMIAAVENGIAVTVEHLKALSLQIDNDIDDAKSDGYDKGYIAAQCAFEGSE